MSARSTVSLSAASSPAASAAAVAISSARLSVLDFALPFPTTMPTSLMAMRGRTGVHPSAEGGDDLGQVHDGPDPGLGRADVGNGVHRAVRSQARRRRRPLVGGPGDGYGRLQGG